MRLCGRAGAGRRLTGGLAPLARYFQTSGRGDYTAVFSQADDVHITMDVEMDT